MSAITSDSDDDLPYPLPLPRDPFLSENFTPSTYLSTLRNRHQTLSDLRAELRNRSQTLQKELLDLVNGEYQAFLDLGSDLRGGDEKVEGVRVGVMGFVKGIEGVKGAVAARRGEVENLLKERRRVWEDIEVGRNLLEVHTRIEEVEGALALGDDGSDDDYEEEDEEDGGEPDQIDSARGDGPIMIGKLQRLVRNYMSIRQMMASIGPEHPFLVKQEERLIRVRNTLLLDLDSALKRAQLGGTQTQRKLMQVIMLYGEMNEAKEATKILKEGKAKR